MVKVEGPHEKVSVKDVMKALNLINARKAAGPSEVTTELLSLR